MRVYRLCRRSPSSPSGKLSVRARPRARVSLHGAPDGISLETQIGSRSNSYLSLTRGSDRISIEILFIPHERPQSALP
ncbi:hypothetical protein HQ37_07860 [Porphyromonas sp. COT-239 OH1446]|nr:hypothetical protein HQ37_07860 [Porphyromonas sp. COT-239 OH1446]